MTTLYVKNLHGLFEKTVGLLNKSIPENISFQTKCGIHTFGMKFPIDVIILDKQNQVKALKEHLQPNKFFFWNPRFDRVIELPDGTINKKRISINQTIYLSYIQ